MKTVVEKTSALGRKLNITVPVEVVNEAFKKAFMGLQKNAHIKGFRPGKAPIETIRSVYGERVQQEVVKDLLQIHYFTAVKNENLNPISYPEFEFDSAQENRDFSFSANFDVRPEVELKKYEALEVKVEKFDVDTKKVDQVLENIRHSHVAWHPLLEIRPAATGDMAVVDFDGYVDGKPLEGGKGAGHQLELGSKSFIDGFEEGIVGMNLGDSKTLQLKFPDPYHSKELAGKPVEFKVTLKELKKKSLPELNDEFVQKIMGSGGAPDDTKTVASLRESIQKDLEATEKKRIDDDLKNRLLKKLVELNPVDVPATILQEQKKSLVEDTKKKLLDQGFTDSEFEDYIKKWDGDLNQTASQMIQSGFLIDAIAKKHNLQSNDEDLDQRLAQYAKQTGIERDRIDEFYSQAQQRERLHYMLTEEKVVAFLLTSAKVKEVSAADLKN